VTGSGSGSGSPTSPATTQDSPTSGSEAQAGTPTRRSAEQPRNSAEEHPARHVECRGRRATVVGTRNADRLRGRPGRDVFASRGGDDVISRVDKDDVVCAGSGDDYVISHVTKPGSTDCLAVIVAIGVPLGEAVEDVLVRRTLLSGCSTVVLGSGSGCCWMVRPRGLVAGR